MIYAYAAIKSGVAFANGAPNLTVDTPALIELSKKLNVPIAGKDFKTGQTLMKTILGPGLKTRLLGIDGWFSTNILGNRDGEVLDDIDSFKTKEVSKLSVLESVLEPDKYPTWGLTSKTAATGYHAAIYGAGLQLASMSQPTDLGGLWGVERVWEAPATLNTGDTDDGASTVKLTRLRISFG